MKSVLGCAVLVVLSTAVQALAQSYVIGPPVSLPYTPLTGGTAIVPMSGGSADNDEGVATLPLNFSFPFHGNTYTSVDVHADGLLLFAPNPICNGMGTTSECYGNRVIPGG